MEELVRHGSKINNKGKGVKRKGATLQQESKRSKEKRSYTTTRK